MGGGGLHSGPPHGLNYKKVNFLNRTLVFVSLMHNFAGMVHNKDITWNFDQIQHSLDIMSIFLDLKLRDFLIYIITRNQIRPHGH